jgi:carbon-monoxide dehydrogenase large subunit
MSGRGAEESARWVGARVRRVEDPRFLTGQARFVDDLQPPDVLAIAFVRSPHAHALIQGVQAEAARAFPGVTEVLTGSEAATLVRPLRARYQVPGFRETDHPLLAVDRVRFVGEPVAAVIATDRYVAEDAAERVAVDYEPLPAVADPEAALEADAPVLHPDVGTNVIFRSERQVGDAEAAFRDADVVIREVFRHARQTGVPLEGRACLASYDAAGDSLTLWTSTQIPHLVRSAVAAALDLPEHRLRVVAPDIGGGFGIKAQVFTEEVLICLLARRLGRPVKWVEDRQEHLLASIHAHEQVHFVEIAARRDGTLLAVRARILSDAGAYSAYPFGAAQEALGALRNMAGPYKVAVYACEALGVATNKCPVGSYRGVSRPVTTFVVEGMLDRLARHLGRDPAALRRQNLVQPEDFPYAAPSGVTYDSGSFVEALDRALEQVDYAGWRARQAALRREGRYVGIGIACYTESSAWGSRDFNHRGVAGVAGYEQAAVSVDPSGQVSLRIGTCGHGQGLETVLAQVVAGELGLAAADVQVIQGDTDRCPYGMGTFASRSAASGGSAALLAARQVRDKLLDIAAHALEVHRDDLVLAEGRVGVRGAAARARSLRELADLAYFWPSRLPPGLGPGLEATACYDPPGPTFSNATHAAVAEVDPTTGSVAIRRFVVAEDCGRMLNPLLVDGQVHGGVAQGIGGALFEDLAYDAAGQLQAATLLDYLVPTACDVPAIEISHLETPSRVTPGGQKGMGEGGAIGAPAAIACAVADALAPFGVSVTALPLTPERVYRLLNPADAES